MARLEDLLRQSAARYPDRPAVSLGADSLCYRDLDARSEALAVALVAHGTQPGDRVAHYLDKSPDALVSVFGILKSGAAYVPLDPGSPPERSLKILQGAGIRAMVTSTRKLGPLRKLLRDGAAIETAVFMDVDGADDIVLEGVTVIAGKGLAGPAISSSQAPPFDDPEALAYILYTSGSTGVPKGVAISHRASLAFVEWAARTFQLTADDVVSSHAPFQFDLSILDIYSTVLAGARICLVPAGANMFPRSMADLIESQKITTWYSVPSAWVQMIRAGVVAGRDFSCLRQILFAGEPFPMPSLRELMTLLPDAKYHNLYGPTETNVCTWYALPGMPDVEASLPIGVECCGDAGLILDEDGVEVEEGAVGELAIRGPTLMTGYFNNHDATAASLRPCAASAAPVYFTGDLVRRLKDGNLEFHGRRDSMIKTRGYRVELGEVESAIVKHEGVEEAVAVAVPDEDAGNRIEAWVCPNRPDLRPQEVLRFVAELLPGYMVPAQLRILEDGIPRTATGKADRVSLVKRSQELAAESPKERN